MATNKDHVELKRLIAKVTPPCPQRDNTNASRSELGQLVTELAHAVDTAVFGGEYYARENKSLSRKINDLNHTIQQLKSRPTPAVDLGSDYYARENKSLSRKINSLVEENQLLKCENMTWKAFYARAMSGDFFSGEYNPPQFAVGFSNGTHARPQIAGGPTNGVPARPQIACGPFNEEQARPYSAKSSFLHPERAKLQNTGSDVGLQQPAMSVAALSRMSDKKAATVLSRLSPYNGNATNSASRAASPQIGPEPAPKVAPTIGPQPAPKAGPSIGPQPAPNKVVVAALPDNRKRSYSDADSAPPAKVPKLDYGNPIVRQAVKATAGISAEPKSAMHKLGETMYGTLALGAPGTDSHRSMSEPKDTSMPAVPKFGGTTFGPPGFDNGDRKPEPKESFRGPTLREQLHAADVKQVGETVSAAPGTSDHSFESETKDTSKPAVPEFSKTAYVIPARRTNADRHVESELKGAPKSSIPELAETMPRAPSALSHHVEPEPNDTSELAVPEVSRVPDGSTFSADMKQFGKTMFGVHATSGHPFKKEPKDWDEVL